MKLNIPFMKFRKIAAVVSLIALILSISSLAIKQLNYGLDFTGGTLLELEYQQAVDPNDIRGQLEGLGVENAIVLHFGKTSEVSLRIPPQKEPVLKAIEVKSTLQPLGDTPLSFGDHLLNVLGQATADPITLKKNEFVGPSLGEELRDDGGIAMIVALAVMLIYIAFRFHYRFGIGAVVALFHDVLITLGLFSFFEWTFDQSVMAAVLAVIGYSLNDTIVVADRVRENFMDNLASDDSQGLIDLSLNQTLSRTLITSLTTMMVLFCLYALGGPALEMFSIALMIGVGVGTYSSIYIASSALLALGVKPSQMIEVIEAEEEEEEYSL